jgi:hypothetical protein
MESGADLQFSTAPSLRLLQGGAEQEMDEERDSSRGVRKREKCLEPPDSLRTTRGVVGEPRCGWVFLLCWWVVGPKQVGG